MTDITKTIVDNNWKAADNVRDKGTIDNAELARVVVPLNLMKRIYDLREEYVEKTIMTSENYELDGDILETLKSFKGETQYNTINQDGWYLLVWEDLMNFQSNPNGEEREITLSKFPEVTITSSATNIMGFMQEIVNQIEHETIKSIFIESDFFSYIMNPKKMEESLVVDLVNSYGNMKYDSSLSTDVFSEIYMDLIARFAEGSGKKGGEFYTPYQISLVAARVLQPELNETGITKITDTTSGSGTMAITLFEVLKSKYSADEVIDKLHVHLQEKNHQTYVLGESGLILSGLKHINAINANTITDYSSTIGLERGEFDYFIGNPPYGLNDYGFKIVSEQLSEEPRWQMGIPKKGEGEYAFIQTDLDLLKHTGKGSLVLPLGITFKDSTKSIRKQIIENNLIEGIIVLPGNMFQTTGIPTCIVVFNKNKKPEDMDKIFMIDTTNYSTKDGKFQTIDYDKLVETYVNRKDEEGYSGYVELSDIIENDYNLSVQRYIFKDEPEEEIDIVGLVNEIQTLETKISEQKSEMDNVFSQIIALQGKK